MTMDVFNVRESNNFSLGASGFDVITGTKTPPSGFTYNILMTDEDATYGATSLTGDNLPSADRIANSVRFGVFSEVQATSGTVLGYYFPIGRS